jgi:biotin carboxyl carrier protein
MGQPTTVTASLRPHEYLVTLNGVQVRVYCPPNGKIEVDGREVQAILDLSAMGNGSVELDGKRYHIMLDPVDQKGRECTVLVNGRRASGTLDDQRSLLRQGMDHAQGPDTAPLTVKAPMPGLVIKILVQPGQEVPRGEGLLILEAMKMENEMKADRTGVVDSIMVAEGSAVEMGQPLIRIRFLG